jgi:glycerol-3-phosphate acyltransferase PlsX
MRIAIDAMGGDKAPAEVVTGALRAARDFHVGLILVGDETAIRRYLPQQLPPDIEIVHSTQIVEMDESPAQAHRKKKDSSIAVATRLHAEGRAAAVLSAGNTGAAATSALFALKPIAGIDRPGIATVFPTQKHPLVLLDAGATVDCRPRHLAEFAIMGAAYTRVVDNIIPGVKTERIQGLPTVGLLSIGEEAAKGNELTKAAYKLLEENQKFGGYQFFGNVEGRDIGAGTVDVVVCDGFVGNVVLKVAEGFAKMFAGSLRESLTRDWQSKMGTLLLRRSLTSFKKRLDYTEYGGAALLGVNGVSIICHGSSDWRSIYSAIRIAKQTVAADIPGTIREAVKHLPAKEKSATKSDESAAENNESASA